MAVDLRALAPGLYSLPSGGLRLFQPTDYGTYWCSGGGRAAPHPIAALHWTVVWYLQCPSSAREPVLTGMAHVTCLAHAAAMSQRDYNNRVAVSDHPSGRQPRDIYRRRVYRAEAGLPTGTLFFSQPLLNDYVSDLWVELGVEPVPPPLVEIDRRLRRTKGLACTNRLIRVAAPPVEERVLLHELAHALIASYGWRGRVSAHGPEFLWEYLGLVNQRLGRESRNLLAERLLAERLPLRQQPYICPGADDGTTGRPLPIAIHYGLSLAAVSTGQGPKEER